MYLFISEHITNAYNTTSKINIVQSICELRIAHVITFDVMVYCVYYAVFFKYIYCLIPIIKTKTKVIETNAFFFIIHVIGAM